MTHDPWFPEADDVSRLFTSSFHPDSEFKRASEGISACGGERGVLQVDPKEGPQLVLD